MRLPFNQIPVKSSASTLYIFNGDDLQKMPWYEAAQENNGLAVSLATEIRHNNQDIICFSRYMQYPLKNNDYYFVISLNLGKSKFDTLCRQLNDENEELMIFDQEKLIYDSSNQQDEVINDLVGEDSKAGSGKLLVHNKNQLKKIRGYW